MALSTQERRILAQIEIHLSEDDPRLAHRLERFGRDTTRSPGQPRRRGVRLVAALTLIALGAGIITAFIAAIT